MREKRMERVKDVSRMIRSSGIKSDHSLSHTHTHTHTQGRGIKNEHSLSHTLTHTQGRRIKSEHSLSHTHTREGMRLHNTHVSPESGSRWQYSRQLSPSTHRR